MGTYEDELGIPYWDAWYDLDEDIVLREDQHQEDWVVEDGLLKNLKYDFDTVQNKWDVTVLNEYSIVEQSGDIIKVDDNSSRQIGVIKISKYRSYFKDTPTCKHVKCKFLRYEPYNQKKEPGTNKPKRILQPGDVILLRGYVSESEPNYYLMTLDDKYNVGDEVDFPRGPGKGWSTLKIEEVIYSNMLTLPKDVEALGNVQMI